MLDLLEPLSEYDLPNFNFDSSLLNDPVAEQTDWMPLISGGSNSQTRAFKQLSTDRVAFRPSSSVMASVVIIFSIFIFMTGIPMYQMIRRGTFEFSPLPLVGLIFAGIGCYTLYRFFTPVLFDRHENAFWKGWKSPDNVIRKDELKDYAPFDEIHALQIVREYCEEKSSSSSGTSRTERFFSYELNLVLKDGVRVNITDHGDQSRLRADAKRLSEFLGKPLWDATL